MNEITTLPTVTDAPFTGAVEVLDAEGNPTGTYTFGEGEATSEEATVFTTAEDGEHVV